MLARLDARRTLVLLAIVLLTFSALAAPGEAAQNQTVGLFLHDEDQAFEGYTLFAPMRSDTTYLIDNRGMLIHTWESGVGLPAYLLDDGSILRNNTAGGNPRFNAGGGTGAVRRFDWDGALTWEFVYSNDDVMAHHDIELLPNGNVLMIAWEARSGAEAIAAGREPGLLRDGELWPEHIIEVEPIKPSGGNIVWEWHVWDHLVQDVDPSAANYGVVAEHPELIDVNFFDSIRPPTGEADWLHANGIDYNEELDQIILSVRHFGEFWVIDHSTTTAEAAGHTGGDSGKGGDILYRWGNPEAYGRGDADDKQLFGQHDAQWIEPSLPGEGNILVFNNGPGRPDGSYSSVDEIAPPVDATGAYALTPGAAYGPAAPAWTYVADPPSEFNSSFISGAVRLPNGNTLIGAGVQGRLFEVTSAGEIVWDYVNPVTEGGPLTQGDEIPPLGNIVFRAYRYLPDYPGLAGRDLTPRGLIELLDSDKDGLSDTDEIGLYETDPYLADTDGDGCSDGQELGDDPMLGGMRDPTDQWDFFDPTEDGRIRIPDIVAVAQRYGQDEGAPGSSYSTRHDRGGAVDGALPWSLLPPDGTIRLADIVGILSQFGHSCG